MEFTVYERQLACSVNFFDAIRHIIGATVIHKVEVSVSNGPNITADILDKVKCKI
jgi:hypothetical protein